MKTNNYIFLFALAFILFSCNSTTPKSEETIPKPEETINLKTTAHELTIDTFYTFPPEIEGCSCYFSNDTLEFKSGAYIYMNDFGKISFMKINGVISKFEEVSRDESNEAKTIIQAKNKEFDMYIEINHDLKSDKELSLKIGVVKITDKNGQSITKSFFGECGC